MLFSYSLFKIPHHWRIFESSRWFVHATQKFWRSVCLCYRFDTRIPVSRLLPPSQTTDLSSCLTQCGVCSWTRPDLRHSVCLQSTYTWIHVCILYVWVFCAVRERPCFWTLRPIHTHKHTPWAIPDRLYMLYMTPLSNSIRYSTQWTPVDRSNATQLVPFIQQKVFYCWPQTCVAALSGQSCASWRAYGVSSTCL